MLSLNSFLKECRSFLHLKNLFIVIGNESCDLDSAVSSITLAYHYNNIKHPATRKYPILPVLNIPRDQLPLKTEVVYFLKNNNIEIENLICKEEINFESLEDFSLILVDHHTSKLNKKIIEVIDHRPFDKNSNLPSDCKINIKTVGSCATLIAENIINEDGNMISIDCMQLLYGTIVLDTVNFSKEADKARPLDIEIVEKIEKILKIDDPVLNRLKMFDDLVKARSDVNSLNSLQILSKDLKIICNESNTKIVAIPGYPILVQEYINLKDSESSLRKFAELNNCDIIVLIGMKVVDGSFQRDLGVINIKNVSLFEKIVSSIQTNDLSLEVIDCSFADGQFFNQKNLKASRKQILPILKNILDFEK